MGYGAVIQNKLGMIKTANTIATDSIGSLLHYDVCIGLGFVKHTENFETVIRVW